MKLLSHCVWLALAACGGSEPPEPASTAGGEMQSTMLATAHQMCQKHGGLVSAQGREEAGTVVALDITCLDGAHGRVSTPVKVARTN